MKAILNKISVVLIGILCAISIQSCSEDSAFTPEPFVVAFSNLSGNLQEIETSTNIALEYSEIAEQQGTVTISISAENAIYGIDFKTQPEANNNEITLSINSGELTNGLTFEKLNPFLDETTAINFQITNIDYSNSNIQGYTKFTLNSSAALGGHLLPNIGGPNEANQVYIDLSSKAQTEVQRDSWDLGFYSGDAFRVTINGSVYMAAGATTFTNIDQVNTANTSDLKKLVAVGTFDPENEAYIDAPSGNILETAIAEVSENDAENKVYLVNLGYEVGTVKPVNGSVAVASDHRGYKKIRVLQRDNHYLLQYADLEATTHQEISIPKTPDFNFTHFSFNSNAIVNVEPEKEQWDVCFTVFTNVIEGSGSYGYSDFVKHNRLGGASAYMVEASNIPYADFNLASIDQSLFQEDQTIIGSNWRDVFTNAADSNYYFIIKDPNDNLYKLRFLAMSNNQGERGHPEFEYELLQ